MEVYLIRHTSPLVEKGICYGQSDLSLAETFQDELDFLKRNLPEQFDAVYTSPLKRCSILAEKLSTTNLFTDARLLELNFGEWEMRKWQDIDQIRLNEWMADFVSCKIPGGESFLDLSYRADQFIAELMQTPFENVAVVAHGGIIRYIVTKILEIPLKNAFKIPIDYSSITRVHFNKDSSYNSLKELNKNYCGRKN